MSTTDPQTIKELQAFVHLANQLSPDKPRDDDQENYHTGIWAIASPIARRIEELKEGL